MAETFSDNDEGKTVVDTDGNEIGRIKEVRGDTAHVDPNPGLGDSIMSKLGWGDADQEDYQLQSSEVDSVTDDQVRLRRM